MSTPPQLRALLSISARPPILAEILNKRLGAYSTKLAVFTQSHWQFVS